MMLQIHRNDDAARQEMKIAIEGLGKHLAAINGRFTRDMVEYQSKVSELFRDMKVNYGY